MGKWAYGINEPSHRKSEQKKYFFWFQLTNNTSPAQRYEGMGNSIKNLFYIFKIIYIIDTLFATKILQAY